MLTNRTRRVILLVVACLLSAGVTGLLVSCSRSQGYVPVILGVRYLTTAPEPQDDQEVAEILEWLFRYDVVPLGNRRLEVRIPTFNGRPVVAPGHFIDEKVLRFSYAQLAALTDLPDDSQDGGNDGNSDMRARRAYIPLASNAMVLETLPALVNGDVRLPVEPDLSAPIGKDKIILFGLVGVMHGRHGERAVTFPFLDSGELERLGKFLESHKGKPMALCFGGKVMVAPLRVTIEEGSLVLRGRMSREQALRVFCLLPALGQPYRLFPASDDVVVAPASSSPAEPGK